MKDKYTELLMCLDCASIAGAQQDNAMKALLNFLGKLKKRKDEEINMSMVTFNSIYRHNIDNKPLAKEKPENYGFSTEGVCAMLDASEYLMNNAGARLSDTPEEERPSQVIFLICVFGRDNASKSCTYEKLKEMIALQRDVYKWKFYLITDFTINMEKLGIADEDTLVIHKDDIDMFKAPYAELTDMVNDFLDKRYGKCQA